MKFAPLYDLVLVKRADAVTKTSGGILIPEKAQEKPGEGIVVAVGQGVRTKDGTLVPLGVNVGDRVVFGKWSGTEVTVDGTPMMIMKEADLLGVLS